MFINFVVIQSKLITNPPSMKFKIALFVFGMGAFLFASSFTLAAKEVNADTFHNLMFNDVEQTHENFDAIYFLYNTNVIEGYEGEKGRSYKPDNKINRAEFLKLIMEGSDHASHQTYEKCFNDVDPDAWYATYICQAKEEGVVNGYGEGKFKPDQTITEVEALKILGELEDWKIEKNPLEEWFRPYLDFAGEREIIETQETGNQMTRGDIAEIIYRNTQVEELKIDKFDEKLEDELFYNFNVPYGGPMGPGGIFGPGGLFGETGAFEENAYFAGNDGDFEILGEDFYGNRYCYYSDEGDFMDQVEDILNYISGGNIEEIELAGYDTDGFGVMFCYNEKTATDLQLFTKELREEYNVKCWLDPIFSMSAQGDFERLLCYAEPEKPKWLSEDSYCAQEMVGNNLLCTTCYKDVFSQEIISNECSEYVKTDKEAKELEEGKDLYIEINGNGEITAGLEKAQFEFFLTDNEGNPIKNRQLKMVASTGIDYSKEFEVKEAGMGYYKADFAPKLAGLYILTVIDELSGTKNDVTLRVNAGAVDHIEIIDIFQPHETLEPNKALIRVASKDQFNNTVPYSSSLNHLTAATSLGKVTVSNDDDIFNFEIEADDWGTAEVSIYYRNNLVGEKVEINFFPIQIAIPKGISLDDGQIEAPIYIYFPEKYGQISSYDFSVNYDSDSIKFSNLVDFNENDDVTTPLFDVENGFIHVWQPKTEVNPSMPEILPIGTMLFNVTNAGDGTVYVSDAVIKDAEGQKEEFSKNFVNNSDGEISDFSGGLWGGTHTVKPTKNICLEAFVLPLPPGTGGAPIVAVTPSATEAEIAADVAQTNEIFRAIARSCNCKFYLNFQLKTPVKNLSYAEVDAFDANNNNIIESDGLPHDPFADEIDKMIQKNPPSPDCIPLYYVPQLNSGGGDALLGISRHSVNAEGIVIDNSRDNDGRTLGHELAHQLSENKVNDPDGPDAHAEGADQAGNLMNYDHTGDNLTVKQCEEIEKKLP